MAEVLQGANPAMIFIVGIMALFGIIAIPCWIVGVIYFAYRWLRSPRVMPEHDMQCGWGGPLTRNNYTGWCGLRKWHWGQHIWTRDLPSDAAEKPA